MRRWNSASRTNGAAESNRTMWNGRGQAARKQRGRREPWHRPAGPVTSSRRTAGPQHRYRPLPDTATSSGGPRIITASHASAWHGPVAAGGPRIAVPTTCLAGSPAPARPAAGERAADQPCGRQEWWLSVRVAVYPRRDRRPVTSRPAHRAPILTREHRVPWKGGTGDPSCTARRDLARRSSPAAPLGAQPNPSGVRAVLRRRLLAPALLRPPEGRILRSVPRRPPRVGPRRAGTRVGPSGLDRRSPVLRPARAARVRRRRLPGDHPVAADLRGRLQQRPPPPRRPPGPQRRPVPRAPGRQRRVGRGRERPARRHASPCTAGCRCSAARRRARRCTRRERERSRTRR